MADLALPLRSTSTAASSGCHGGASFRSPFELALVPCAHTFNMSSGSIIFHDIHEIVFYYFMVGHEIPTTFSCCFPNSIAPLSYDIPKVLGVTVIVIQHYTILRFAF